MYSHNQTGATIQTWCFRTWSIFTTRTSCSRNTCTLSSTSSCHTALSPMFTCLDGLNIDTEGDTGCIAIRCIARALMMHCYMLFSNQHLSITERKSTIGLWTVAILGASWSFITVHWCILNTSLQPTHDFRPRKTYHTIFRAGIPFGTSRTGCQVTWFWSIAIITITFPVVNSSWYLNHLTDTMRNFQEKVKIFETSFNLDGWNITLSI